MANQMKTLTLEYLAPYLPYDLNIIFIDDDYSPFEDKITKIILPNKSHNGAIETKNGLDLSLDDFKPILRPLSDLGCEVSFGNKAFKSDEYISTSIKDSQLNHRIILGGNCDQLQHWKFQRLLQMNFDVFGLIEAGLAIDINTLTPNT